MNQSDEKRPFDLKVRTKQFALRIIRLYSALPKSGAGQVLGHQLLRSGTSVGAQYREGTRARSSAEFISKLQSALQELEESRYWLELIVDSGLFTEARMVELIQEADELTAILTTTVKRTKLNRSGSKSDS